MSDTVDTTTLEEAPPRRLVRVDDGRWLGGVAAGLGRYFDVNPLVYRIAFVALAFAGGTGVLLYLAAWLVIPAEDREESIAVEALRLHRDRPWLLLGVGLLFFGAVLALSEARVWPGPGNVWLAAVLAGGALVWWHVSARESRAGAAAVTAPAPVGQPPTARPAPPPRKPSLLAPVFGGLLAVAGVFGLLDVLDVYEIDLALALAVAVAIVGGAIAVGAVTGRRVGGLVVLGLVLLPAFAVAVSLPVSLGSGVGNRVETASATGSIERSYELGIGDLTVDLSGASLAPGRTQVDANLGIGELVVVVPSDVALDIDAHAGLGDVEILGQHEDGTGVRVERFYPGPTDNAPVLELDADVGIGDLVVMRG